MWCLMKAPVPIKTSAGEDRSLTSNSSDTDFVQQAMEVEVLVGVSHSETCEMTSHVDGDTINMDKTTINVGEILSNVDEMTSNMNEMISNVGKITSNTTSIVEFSLEKLHSKFERSLLSHKSYSKSGELVTQKR